MILLVSLVKTNTIALYIIYIYLKHEVLNHPRIPFTFRMLKWLYIHIA